MRERSESTPEPGATDPLGRLFADEAHGGASEQRAAARVRQALLGTIDPSSKLARYRLLDVLGRGAMGEVWIAEDPELSRRVAIKIVRPDAREGTRHGDRLAREARALAALSHPNVVQVFDAGVHEAEGTRTRSVFIVMELVEGETLAAWLTRRPGVQRIVAVFLQAAAGLAAAHAVGLVHRDFKPANVFIGRDGRARVGDFGLAREAGGAAPPVSEPPASIELLATAAAELTRTGAILGTPLYMAPEQHLGLVTDARSDQYAFCVALYEALYEVRPFAGDLAGVVAAKLERALVDNPGATVPAAVKAVVMRGLSADPAERWPTMDELSHALSRSIRPRWRRPALAGGVAATALAAVLVTFATAGGTPCPGLQRATQAWNPEARRSLDGVLVELDGVVRHDLLLHAIDVQAERLEQAQGQLCSAPQQGPAVAACVAAAQSEFEAMLELFSHGTPALMVRATLQVSELPDPLACAQAAEPTRDRPELAAAIAEAREQLAQVRVRVRSGMNSEAAAIAGDAITELEAAGVDDDATLDALRLMQGLAEDDLGLRGLAEGTLERAYYGAVRSGASALAMRAAGRLAVNAAERSDPEGAQRWLRHAEIAHTQDPGDSYDEGTYWQVVGAVRGYAGDLVGAREAFERSAHACDEGRCPSLHAAAVDNLAEAAIVLGEPELGVTLRERVVEEVAATNGDDAVLTAFARLQLAEALWSAGRGLEALAAIERARAVIERFEGPNHPSLANASLVTASAAIDAGDYATAVVAAREAVARIEAITVPESPRRASYLGTLAEALDGAGDHAEALRIYERAMVAADQASVVDRAPLLVGRAAARLRAGDAEGAIADARTLRTLELGSAYEVADHLRAAFETEAKAHVLRGDRVAAVAVLDEGIAWAETAEDPRALSSLPALRAELSAAPAGSESVSPSSLAPPR